METSTFRRNILQFLKVLRCVTFFPRYHFIILEMVYLLDILELRWISHIAIIIKKNVVSFNSTLLIYMLVLFRFTYSLPHILYLSSLNTCFSLIDSKSKSISN